MAPDVARWGTINRGASGDALKSQEGHSHITGWIELRSGTLYLPFRDLPHLIANALWPLSAETEDEAVQNGWNVAGSRINLESELKAAVQRGQLEVLDPLTRGPHPFPIGAMLNDALVRVEHLDAYLAERGVGIRFIPHFVTSAWPKCVPPELLVLPANARITYEDNIGGVRESGATSAGEYRATILDTIARQAEGYFTLCEAAQVLADSRPGIDATEAVKRFLRAHSDDGLPIHQRGSRFPLEVGETIRDFWDTVEVTELDAWLRASAGYGFPKAEGAAVPAAAADGGRAQAHALKRRSDPLAAVLTLAEGHAVDAKDWQSVWAALVALAESPTRPAPLLGYVEGEGVQYRADDADQPASYLSREALRARFRRKR